MAIPDDTQYAFEQLKQQIKLKQPRNFYVFCGPEAYLRAAYLERLHNLVVDEVTESFNYHRYNSDTLTPEALSDSLNAIPMMAERTMIQIDDVDFFRMNAEDRAAYASLLADIPAYCTLVLVYDTQDYAPLKKDKDLSAAMAGALVVSFERPSERELCVWIARHFKPHGKTVGYDVCQYLISRTGGEMTTLHAEIEKVAAYAKAETITREDIDAVVEPVLEAKIFDLTDAICDGNYDKAVQDLAILLQRQEIPNAILAAISGQFRRIQMAKTLAAAGMTSGALLQYGVSKYPAQRAFTYAKRLSDRFCDAAVLLCLETDYQMKRSVDDEERLLEFLLLRLAQEARQ